MKPPIIPRPLDIDKHPVEGGNHSEEGSMDTLRAPVSVDPKDPFREFVNVNKPEGPSERELEQHEAQNNENE